MQIPYLIAETGDVRGVRRATLGDTRDMFASWSFEKQRLIVESDRYGMQPLFRADLPNGYAVSASPIQLIAQGVSPEWNLEALAIFHLLGYFIDDDTPFKTIRVTQGDFRPPSDPVKVTTLQQAVEEYARLFTQAISRCGDAVTGRLVIPLSGGRDSRHMLLEALRQGLPLDHCLTFDASMGAATDPDAYGARLVAERLGVRHQMINTLESRYRDQIITHGRAHCLTDEHVQYLAADRYFAGRNCSVFDGIAGDSLSRNKGFTNPAMVEMIRAGKLRNAAEHIVAENERITKVRWADQVKIFPEIAPYRAQAIERIMAAFERERDRPDPYAHFIFRHRTRREIALAPTTMLSSAKQMFAPYLDPDLAEFCLALPYEITCDGKFHDHVIAHSFPDFDVPYSDGFKGAWPSPSIGQRVKRMTDAVSAARLWGWPGVAREAIRQARLLAQPSRAPLYKWETYRETLNAVSSPTKAEAYLERL